jgi:hypothetical protein
MLGAKCFAGLEAFAKTLFEDAENGGNARFVAFPGFRVFERHPFDLQHIQQPEGRLVWDKRRRL